MIFSIYAESQEKWYTAYTIFDIAKNNKNPQLINPEEPPKQQKAVTVYKYIESKFTQYMNGYEVF